MQTDFDAMKARLENDNKELTIAKDNIIDTLRKDLKASEELAEKRQAELVEVGQKMALAAREGCAPRCTGSAAWLRLQFTRMRL